MTESSIAPIRASRHEGQGLMLDEWWPAPRPEPSDMDEARLVKMLDLVLTRMLDGDVNGAMDNLFTFLRIHRHVLTEQSWRLSIQRVCRRHPLWGLLLRDPLTRRAYDKPRGSAGDPVMLDYYYSRTAPAGISHCGQSIFDYLVDTPTAHSIRRRRDLLAGTVDRVADRFDRPRVLAVSSGYLPEGRQSRAFQAGRIGTYFALDGDAESLATIQRVYGGLGLRPVHASVNWLLQPAMSLTDLHLAYAGGLYDTLADDAARSLTRRLLEMLVPGGTLVIAGFAPTNHGREYMEAFMDWNVYCRDELDLERLISGPLSNLIASSRMYRETMGNIVFLECTKA